jgi:hypothetical protein
MQAYRVQAEAHGADLCSVCKVFAQTRGHCMKFPIHGT